VHHTIIHILTTLYGLATLLLVSALFLLLFPLLHAHGKLVRGHSPRGTMRRLICLYGRSWLFCIRPLVRQEVCMPTAKDMPRPCIVVCNHLSALDVFFMSLLPVGNVIVAVRSWPFRMFWYAPFMRLAGYLDMESEDSEDIRARIKACMEEGGVVVFFRKRPMSC
jgi:1-acyl-sn-glycerol-3-phosphate acyltransferase